MRRIATIYGLLLALFWGGAIHAAGPTTQAVNSPVQSLRNLVARAADLHTATTDVATIAIPSSSS